jgi:hypothetical protein
MFDYTRAMELLIKHIVKTCKEFSHIRPEQMIVSYIKARSPGTHGVYASVQPLRFEGGTLTVQRGKKVFAMPQIEHKGQEVLYIIYIVLPRFANLDFQTKLITVFHELYHISPQFNGDIRRFPGKKFAHGYSRKRYNELMHKFADAYLTVPDAHEYTDFLHLKFDDLVREYGGVKGTRIRPPKPRLVL